MTKHISALFVSLLLATAGTAFSEVATENFNTFTVDNFSTAWTIVGSGNMDPSALSVKIVDAGANNAGLDPSGNKDTKSMGLKASFFSMGYNWISLTPPKSITLPGKAVKIQIWILGMKYRYNLEVYVQDFKGFIHTIDMGSIYFEGWKSMTADIPIQIPQQDEGYPRDRPLKIIKMVLRADPNEQSDRFYIYFNSIKVFTDVYQSTFDGMDLINKTTW